MKKHVFALAAIASLVAPVSLAKVAPQEAEKLGSPHLTCMGAERAGNADGSIPAFNGIWVGDQAWPGAKLQGYDPGPYASEKPLFTITAENAETYASKLTAGQKALFKRYPKSFRMPVYPSHRDFAYAQWVCDVVKKNAAESEIVNGGLGFTGTTGGVPFPLPKDGLEAQWNTQNAHRAWTEQSVQDQAVVYPDGRKAWGKVNYRILSVANDPNKRGSNQDLVNAYFNVETLLPERERGTVIIGWSPNDTTNDRQAYLYNPGVRRVRQAPEYGFDTPQGAGGFRTVDDDRLFNGSPERYDWKLVGKKEIYVPYDAFGINDPAIRYDQLLTPNTINPDYMRYELHRVWVIAAQVKPGMRHVYKRREIYVDEDTWHPLWADNYDHRDQLWRVSLVNYFYAPGMAAYQAGVSVYHDLTADAYFADRLVNQSKQWWRLNVGDLTPEMFAPEAAKRQGH
ncbi:MAG TPA: DUF1329 domain-containing protein [Nevskiaceae bacterium]|nr:DUF1329 domain-containing protein [Nevskiaceae bacterium]